MKIVFVQLANTPKSYVWENIKQSKKIFPNFEHILITDDPKIINKAIARNIYSWRYEATSEINEIFEALQTDKSFRSGFWRLTLERLIALTRFHQSTNGDPLLHVESDVILAENFPFQKIAELSKILWFPFSSNRDVASLLYLPNSSESAWLEKEILSEITINPSSTDMTALSRIAERSDSRVGYFPVIEDKDSKLLSARSTKQFAIRASQYSEHFSGIFDAAPLGMWITGQDPKNNRGYILKHSDLPDSFVNPNCLKERIVSDNRNKIYYQNIQIFNLHIHSKKEKYFRTKNWKLISKEIMKEDEWTETKSFSLAAFCDLAKSYIWRRVRRLIQTLELDS